MPHPKLLFLPGTLCDERLFAPQIAALAPLVDCRVGDVAAADSLAECARYILSNAPPRFLLCGLSWGGIIALEIMRQQPATRRTPRPVELQRPPRLR